MCSDILERIRYGCMLECAVTLTINSIGVQVIARVGGLTMLNSSVVHSYERRDSELQYFRGLLGAQYPSIINIYRVIFTIFESCGTNNAAV